MCLSESEEKQRKQIEYLKTDIGIHPKEKISQKNINCSIQTGCKPSKFTRARHIFPDPKIVYIAKMGRWKRYGKSFMPIYASLMWIRCLSNVLAIALEEYWIRDLINDCLGGKKEESLSERENNSLKL
ncbi:hypothetical protein WA026_014964 [Henosepilachna vigintioctopunctata]|uniref:Uncharacterized protein n=1 Tax=Henosepilachna vigintioctopunctata TaxID=420089 RepID=A0AAW1U9P2_9CUCU